MPVAGDGVTARDTSVPVPTVSVVVPLTPDADAVMVTDPAFLPCTMPLPRIEATLGFDDFQETPARFVAVLPSLNVPVTVNFSEVPLAIRGLAGLIVIETRCAVETVSVVDPVTELSAAVMVALPVVTLVA